MVSSRREVRRGNGTRAPGRGLLAAVALCCLIGCDSGKSTTPGLVVYCAHDAVFAEDVLRDFERQTGIAVTVRYDSEATKSLGFVNMLIQEKANPQCDVFWNNELLGTCELHEQGVLAPYRGPGFERIPERFKDPDGHWTGFAARLRVYIVNTEKMAADEAALREKLEGQADLTRVAIAEPLFGTTLTQYTVLWSELGEDGLKNWHKDLHARGIREVKGNAATKNLVAEGACDFGFTDNDDYFVAKDAGKPVAQLPVRVAGKTICIPNSVAIIRGTPRIDAARKLVDYLLSAETELRLAKSESRQIPLGPVSSDQVPADVRPLVAWGAEGADLRPLLESRRAVVRWLKSEYLR
ncbi:MAG: ABC transporter substrate-binding protein [Planctomycetia bacterium]|nr:ABC transporter substrate-binding protein [Planctomycetia bacterium]